MDNKRYKYKEKRRTENEKTKDEAIYICQRS